jgi:hypothetical protein
MAPAIHQSDAFADAFTAGRWIGDFAFNSAAHKDIKALANAVRKLGKGMNGGETNSVLSIQANKRAPDVAATDDAVEYAAGAAANKTETD